MPQINRTSDDNQDDVAANVAPGRFPGWYHDPRNSEDERFWNGSAWTDLTRAAPKLADFLGPIEPTLLSLLSDTDESVAAEGTDSLRRVQEFMAS